MENEIKKYYTSDKTFQVIRYLSTKSAPKETGKGIRQTYATWTGEENFISFAPGKATGLTAEDLELPQIKKLISNHIIYETINR